MGSFQVHRASDSSIRIYCYGVNIGQKIRIFIRYDEQNNKDKLYDESYIVNSSVPNYKFSGFIEGRKYACNIAFDPDSTSGGWGKAQSFYFSLAKHSVNSIDSNSANLLIYNLTPYQWVRVICFPSNNSDNIIFEKSFYADSFGNNLMVEITGLSSETNYSVYIKLGELYSDIKSFTTKPELYPIYIHTDNGWQPAIPYIYISGRWVLATPYVYSSGWNITRS